MRVKSAILVTGAPRSGTTFLGKMLALPREVVYVDEPLNHQTGLAEATIPFPYLQEGSEQTAHYEKLIDDLLMGSGKYRQDPYRKPTPNPTKLIMRALVNSRTNFEYQKGKLYPWTKTYLLKDPMACMASEYIHRHYKVPTVVILRHPASTIASYKRLGWPFTPQELTRQDDLRRHLKYLPPKSKPTPLEEWSYFWLNVYERLTTFVKRNPGMILIKHEDLSLNPEKELRNLYRRLGLPYRPSVQRKIKDYTSAKNPTDPPNNIEHHLKRNSKANIHRWKKILTADEVGHIRNITEVLAKKYYSNKDWD